MTAWPESRSDTYDEDKTWDTENDAWSSDPAVLAGTASRYRQYIIAIVRGDTIFYGEA